MANSDDDVLLATAQEICARVEAFDKDVEESIEYPMRNVRKRVKQFKQLVARSVPVDAVAGAGVTLSSGTSPAPRFSLQQECEGGEIITDPDGRQYCCKPDLLPPHTIHCTPIGDGPPVPAPDPSPTPPGGNGEPPPITTLPGGNGDNALEKCCAALDKIASAFKCGPSSGPPNGEPPPIPTMPGGNGEPPWELLNGSLNPPVQEFECPPGTVPGEQPFTCAVEGEPQPSPSPPGGNGGNGIGTGECCLQVCIVGDKTKDTLDGGNGNGKYQCGPPTVPDTKIQYYREIDAEECEPPLEGPNQELLDLFLVLGHPDLLWI